MKKEFYEHWNDSEVQEWIDNYNVLVLFNVNTSAGEAEVLVYGNLSFSETMALKIEISREFGRKYMTKSICNKINEFAERWYNKTILKTKARVINVNKKKI